MIPGFLHKLLTEVRGLSRKKYIKQCAASRHSEFTLPLQRLILWPGWKGLFWLHSKIYLGVIPFQKNVIMRWAVYGLRFAQQTTFRNGV